jgi:hypothetical protein
MVAVDSTDPDPTALLAGVDASDATQEIRRLRELVVDRAGYFHVVWPVAIEPFARG